MAFKLWANWLYVERPIFHTNGVKFGALFNVKNHHHHFTLKLTLFR